MPGAKGEACLPHSLLPDLQALVGVPPIPQEKQPFFVPCLRAASFKDPCCKGFLVLIISPWFHPTPPLLQKKENLDFLEPLCVSYLLNPFHTCWVLGLSTSCEPLWRAAFPFYPPIQGTWDLLGGKSSISTSSRTFDPHLRLFWQIKGVHTEIPLWKNPKEGDLRGDQTNPGRTSKVFSGFSVSVFL